ncbi:MAG: DNA-deoxyinosine glycosylase [Ruminococcus sp.]|nr:DNA-deoxyinosine glycosylase [Ruminococcus sp.]
MSDTQRIIHPIPPLFDKNCTKLILGSFPSVKSREAQFFYGHPQNRYWRLLAELLGEEVPQTVEEKSALALKHHIAMWDTINSCTITGSSDSSIKDVVPNDLSVILENSKVTQIFANGATSYNLYQKYIYPVTKIKAVKLPSTSSANATFSLERLKESWSIIVK